MSAKDTTGTKKEKSFNGSKAKYSPNPPVLEKKEVKMRHKESVKVKQTNDSTRRSVLGRLFQNLVDSEDSRKKNALTDAKKRRTAGDLEGPGADLDLPEHGIILHKIQTFEGNQETVPSSRVRASTLSNQGGNSHNRWSSYDIQSTNLTERVLPPHAMQQQQDCATFGHRSQSDEKLNDQNVSKFTENFEIVNLSDAKTQPDAMRKHVQLLKTIQEQHAMKATRSEKTYEFQVGQAANGWLLSSGDTVTCSQGRNVDTAEAKDADRKSNVLNVLSESGSTTDTRTKLRAEQSGLLLSCQDKGEEIHKALAERRRILSDLFRTPEEDMERLIEMDVVSSKDLTVRTMILISLLQSDHLTSVLNNSLVPHRDATPDGVTGEEVVNQKGGKSINEQNDRTFTIQSLQSAAVRLHQNVKLLAELFNQEVSESGRLKKELEEVQNRLKKKDSEKSLQETKLTNICCSPLIQQEIANTSSEPDSPAENKAHELLSKALELELGLNGSSVADELLDVGNENNSVNEAVRHNSATSVEIPDGDASDISLLEDGRKFRNLESIPEDDDKLSTYDAEQEQEYVFDDDSYRISDVVQISVKHSGDEDIFLSLDVENDQTSDAENDGLSNVKARIQSEVSGFSQSNMEADVIMNFRDDDDDDDHLQLYADAEDQSTSEDSVHSRTDGVICGLVSDVDVVLPAAHIVANQDGSMFNWDVSQFKVMEQTSENLSMEHMTLCNGSDENPVKHSTELPGNKIDDENKI